MHQTHHSASPPAEDPSEARCGSGSHIAAPLLPAFPPTILVPANDRMRGSHAGQTLSRSPTIPNYFPSPPHQPLPCPGLQVWLDAGAVRAVKDKHKSLFAPGIVKVCGAGGGSLCECSGGWEGAEAAAFEGGRGALLSTSLPRRPEVTLCIVASPPSPQVTGDFHVQDAVQLCDDAGVEFARALFNFSSEELDRIVKGRLWRSDLAQNLGYGTMEEVAHRGNITLLASSSYSEGGAGAAHEEDHEEEEDDAAPPVTGRRALGRHASGAAASPLRPVQVAPPQQSSEAAAAAGLAQHLDGMSMQQQ